ncbi:hypothetical protein IV48_GL001077 [Fructilactobacillus fructivorans]|nr:hypothetical protein IV48_GL001077 [Fructilactobacillus fructivorans]
METSEDVDVIATNDEEIESRVVLEGILAQLDDRECQMVSGLYNGQSMTAIASELHVSRKTLYQWRKRIIKKLIGVTHLPADSFLVGVRGWPTALTK